MSGEATEAKDTTTTTDSGEDKHPLSGFEGLQVDDEPKNEEVKTDEPDKGEEAKPAEEGQPEEKPDDEGKDDEGQDDAGDDAKDKGDDADGGDDEGEDKDTDGEGDGEGGDAEASGEIELKIPESEKEEEAPETWKTVADELDLKVDGDDFSNFKEAYDNKISGLKDEVLEDIKKDPMQALDIKDEKTKEIVEFAIQGGDLAQLIDPAQEYNQYLALNNHDLLKQDYLARGLSEEDANNRVQKDIENNDADIKASDIRMDLISHRDEAIQEVITASKERSEAIKQEESDKKAEADKLFTEELTGRQEYRGIPLKQEHRDYIAGLWNSGQVHDMLRSQKNVVDFLLGASFDEQINKRQQEAARSAGRDEVKQDLHNTKPDVDAGTSRTQTSTDKDGFDLWDDVSSDSGDGGIEVEYVRS